MTTKPIPMSDADRDALSKKRDAASPGRWTAQRMEDGAWLVRTDDGGVPYSVAQIPQSRPGYTSPNDRADAVFIAESYNALPSLLSALAASEERARRAEQALRGFLDVFWPTADEGHTGFVDRLGMQFYRETGIWPPFKSEPMEIARPDVDREEASKKWRAWLDAKRDAAAAAAVRDE